MKKPIRFSFDPGKDARNIAHRGLSLSAVNEFVFETAVAWTDERFDYGERREIALGFLDQRLHALVFTMRGETCHVISLRKTNKREIAFYVEATKDLE